MLSTATRSLFTHTHRTISRIGKEFISMLFPDECISCGTRDMFICKTCLAAIPFSPIFATKDISAATSYQNDTIKTALRALKYHNRTHTVRILTPRIAPVFTEILENRNIRGPIVLIPIPLSRKRMRTRGFNQAELFARALAAYDPVRISVATDILSKTRETTAQARTDTRTLRLENLRDSFAAKNPATLSGKTVIVVDDITTTGATFAEARRALSTAGVRVKFCFAVAH